MKKKASNFEGLLHLATATDLLEDVKKLKTLFTDMLLKEV